MAQTGYTPIQLYYSTTTTNAPSAGNLASGELAINITDGKLFYKDNGGSVQVIAWKTTPTTAGGTGLTSWTAGDLPYYSTGTTLTKLGIGTNGQILTSTGTAPQWSTLSGVAVTTFSAGTTGFTPSVATSGAVTLAGTLATTNGGTGLTSFTANRVFYSSSTSTIGSSANLTFDGTTLTAANFADSSLTSGRVTYATTSGNLTDSANLLFDGTTLTANALTTTSTVTINGGTANGVAYLNGSKVLTTGSALTFNGTTLFRGGADSAFAMIVSGVSKAVRLGMDSTGGYIEGVDNTGSVSYQPLFVGGSDLRFLISGSEQMRLTSTGLGIGTSSPSYKLTVNGTMARTVGSGANGGFVVNDGTNDLIAIGTGGFAANGGTATDGGLRTTNNMVFATGSGSPERMRIDSSGNVGIGTSSPVDNGAGYKTLTLNSTTSGVLEVQNNGTSRGQIFSDASNFIFNAKSASTGYKWNLTGSTAMTLDSSGNLGLGVTPSAWSGFRAMQIGSTSSLWSGTSGNASSFYTNNGYFNGSNRIYLTNGYATEYIQGQGQHIWYTAASGTAGNTISFSQVMTLDASGNLGIGTSSPDTKLRVVGTAFFGTTGASDTNLRIGALNASNVYLQANSYDGLTAKGFVFYNGGSPNMTLDSSGNLAVGASSTTGYWPSNLTQTAARQIISYSDATTNLDNANAGLVIFNSNSTAGSSSKLVFGANNSDPTAVGLAYISAVNSTRSSGYLSSSLVFGTTGTNNAVGPAERMRIDPAGNLGLGVTPSAWGSTQRAFETQAGSLAALSTSLFDLVQNTYNSGTSYIYKTTAAATVYRQTAGAHQWFNAASGTAGNTISFTQAMTLSAAGGLSVGLTSDAGAGNLLANGAYLKQAVSLGSNASPASEVGMQYQYSSSANRAGIYFLNTYANNGAAWMSFWTSDSSNTYAERARIDSSGNLLVGTTDATPYNNNSNTSADNGVVISNTGQVWAAAYNSDCGNFNRTGSDGVSLYFNRSGSTVGSISVTTTATAYNTSSDYRLKNITGPITNSGAYIDSLNPVEGTWKADGSTFVGLIAHEVQDVSRTPVATGTKDGEEMQGMDYSSAEIIANLIAEVKSLRARVAQLETKGA